jgi:N-acetylneuraminic acid mutarotase
MYNTVAEAIGDKIYVPNGSTGVMYIYDLVSNSWTSGAAMTPRGSSASAVLGGKIYVAGGATIVATRDILERYDPATDTWETLAPMPDRREGPGAGAIDGHFCVFGGRIAQGNPTGNALPDTWCYDPATNSWGKGQDMITPRALVGSVELDGEIYAIGGRLGEPLAIATVEKLVP